MNLLYLMDTMLNLLNESNNLNVKELNEIESSGLFYLTTDDGTKVEIKCSILPSEHD